MTPIFYQLSHGPGIALKFPFVNFRQGKAKDMNPTTSLLFSIGDKVGGLQEALSVIKKYELNMLRIESRPSKTSNWDYDFFVDFENGSQEKLSKLVDDLKTLGYGVSNPGNAGNVKPLLSESQSNIQSRKQKQIFNKSSNTTRFRYE